MVVIEYKIGDVYKFTKVLLITHVISSSDTSDVRGVYDLEDGTGSIRASLINKVGQDPVVFSARVQGLCVMPLNSWDYLIVVLVMEVSPV